MKAAVNIDLFKDEVRANQEVWQLQLNFSYLWLVSAANRH